MFDQFLNCRTLRFQISCSGHRRSSTMFLNRAGFYLAGVAQTLNRTLPFMTTQVAAGPVYRTLIFYSSPSSGPSVLRSGVWLTNLGLWVQSCLGLGLFGFRIRKLWGLGLQGLGFRVQDLLGFQIFQGSGLQGVGFRVVGFWGFRRLGLSGFEVSGFGVLRFRSRINVRVSFLSGTQSRRFRVQGLEQALISFLGFRFP